MIAVQDCEGIGFWPEEEVASVFPEFRNRFRLVHRDGTVAHRPTPCSLGQLFLNPAYARAGNRGWQDPAGFWFAEVSPALTRPEEQADIPGLPCRRSEVWALVAGAKNQCVWRTDRGDFWWNMRPTSASQLMPELIRIFPGRFLNPGRLRRIRHDYTNFYLFLDNGENFRVSKQSELTLAGRLGLSNLLHLEPRWIQLYGSYGLRDWPFELAVAKGSQLRALFPNARVLIGHLVWQRLRYRQLGIQREWAESYRGFWYDVVAPALFRAGFLREVRAELPDYLSPTRLRSPRSESEKLYAMVFQVMDLFVEEAQFFGFREFGFSDPSQAYRRIGDRLPQVLLVAEKESLHPYALRLAQEFGLSLRLLGRQPPLIGSEYLAVALGQATDLDIHQISYVDYDTGGWILGHAQAKQLAFFGKPVASECFLIGGDCFSEEEKRLYAHPCSASTPTLATKTANWVKESGGLDGRPYGIHADHVQPYERVRDLLRRALTHLGLQDD